MFVPRTAAGARRAALLLTVFLFPAGYATLGAVALLGVSLVIAIRRPAAVWQRTPLDLPLAFLILSASLSAVFSPFPAMAAGATALLALLLVLAFGATAATLAQTPGTLLPLLWALSAGSAVAAIWGIILALVTGAPAHTPAIGYNALGTTLATGLPLTLGLAVQSRDRSRMLGAAAAAVILAGLGFTYSRGAWLGGAAGVLLFIVLLPRRAIRPLLAMLAAVLVAAALALAGVAGALGQRLGAVAAPGAIEDRVAMWRAAAAMARDRPLLGSGLNTFGLLYPRYRPADERSSPEQPFAHNILLNAAAEGGVLGLAAFLLTLLGAAAQGVRWLRRRDAHDGERLAAASVLAAVAALMVHQQLDGTAISFHIGFGLWLLLAVLAVEGGHAMAVPPALSSAPSAPTPLAVEKSERDPPEPLQMHVVRQANDAERDHAGQQHIDRGFLV